MTVRRVEPGFQLRPDATAALQATDVRLGFLVHGFDGKQQLGDETYHVVRGVVDGDYQGAAALVDPLVPGRDIFGHELYQAAPLLDPQLRGWKRIGAPLPTQGEYNATSVVRGITRLVSDVSGMTADDYDVLHLASRHMPDPASPAGRQLVATWEKLAAKHATDPVRHAAGLAGMRGVRLWSADATMEEVADFRRKWFRWLPDPPPTSRLERRYGLGPELKFRNNRILERLGEAALTLDAAGSERPILAYAIGAQHRKDLERKLTRHGIPFTSELISPDWRSRKERVLRGEL